LDTANADLLVSISGLVADDGVTSLATLIDLVDGDALGLSFSWSTGGDFGLAIHSEIVESLNVDLSMSWLTMGLSFQLKESDVDHGVVSRVDGFLEADVGRSTLVVNIGLTNVGGTELGGVVNFSESHVSVSLLVLDLQFHEFSNILKVEESNVDHGVITRVDGFLKADVGRSTLVVNVGLTNVGGTELGGVVNLSEGHVSVSLLVLNFQFHEFSNILKVHESNVNHGVITSVGGFLEADVGRSTLVVDVGLSDVGGTELGGVINFTKGHVSVSLLVVDKQLEESNIDFGVISRVDGFLEANVSRSTLVVDVGLSNLGDTILGGVINFSEGHVSVSLLVVDEQLKKTNVDSGVITGVHG